MEIVDFEGRNIEFAKDQPEYLTMPAYRTTDGEITSCWKLSFLERIQVLFTGKVYFTLLTFNRGLSPQRANVKFELGTDGKVK